MLVEAFEKRVKQEPHKLALRVQDTALTYDFLNRYANRLARTIMDIPRLKELPGQHHMALLTGHDEYICFGIMGILKAGHVYIPCDPTYPLERLQYMLSHAGVQVIVTNEKNIENLISIFLCTFFHVRFKLFCFFIHIKNSHYFLIFITIKY